jgi:hypothetical protein
MPWRHAFLPQGTTSQTAKDYEVDRIGLPRLVLVAPDGKVTAVQPDLSPELLDHTLGYYLGTSVWPVMGSKILAPPTSKTAKSSKTPPCVTVHAAYKDFVTLWKGGVYAMLQCVRVVNRPSKVKMRGPFSGSESTA